MKTTPKISEAEWRVMRVLWAKSPATAKEVVESVSPGSTWKPRTIMTLINRLVKKNALSFSKDGRVYQYYPIISESECARAENRSFLQRVYGGTLQPMLAAFLEDTELSEEEIDELKRILDERRAKK